jgi:uncharacterized protein DUF664
MTDSETTSLATPTAAGAVHQDDDARTLLGFLQYQRDAVLKIVDGLPEEAWQTSAVPSGWTVAGMLFHLCGVEHHWLQNVVTGSRSECRRSDTVLAVTPLSAAPRGLGFHSDPEYTALITSAPPTGLAC